MTPSDILEMRLLNQQISRTRMKTPGEVVRAMGAVQAQDYLASLWSVGLRLNGAKQADVEDAIVRREIVRTWPMRGTLHFVPAEDARWMVGLLAPRVVARSLARARRMGIDDEAVARSRKLVVEMLHGGEGRTRGEIYRELERGGVPASGQRGLHLLWRLAHEGLVCLGAHRGRQPTFVLLDEWVLKTRAPRRPADALSVLAERYFTSHGPATLRDFVWWSGLKVSEGRAAVRAAGEKLGKETLGGTEYWGPPSLDASSRAAVRAQLLPALDEYIVAYKDREGMIDPRFAKRMVRGLPVFFVPKIVVDGMVVGTWRRTLRKDEVEVALSLFERMPETHVEAVVAAAERYGRFLGKGVVIAEA